MEEPRRSEFDEIKPRFQPIEGESGRREPKRKGRVRSTNGGPRSLLSLLPKDSDALLDPEMASVIFTMTGLSQERQVFLKHE